jgi:hypothetical protein
MSSTPLYDPGWICLDQGLVWLHHFIMVGLDTLTRDTAESLARNITVHWNWVYKKLMRNLKMIGCSNVCNVVEEFDKLVKSATRYTTKSMTKLKRILDCSPLPPTSPSSCSHMFLLTKLSRDPMLSTAIHRARFLSIFSTEINQNLLLLRAGSKREDDVMADVRVQIDAYHGMVDADTTVLLSADTYLTQQVWALTEQLSLLQNICPDQQLLSLQHRVLLHTSTAQPGWDAAHKVHSILHSLDRPAVQQLHLTEYDPLQQILGATSHATTPPQDLLGVFSNLVNVRDASGSTAIVMAEQKIEQLKEMKEILKNIKFEKEEYIYDDIMVELNKLSML